MKPVTKMGFGVNNGTLLGLMDAPQVLPLNFIHVCRNPKLKPQVKSVFARAHIYKMIRISLIHNVFNYTYTYRLKQHVASPMSNADVKNST